MPLLRAHTMPPGAGENSERAADDFAPGQPVHVAMEVVDAPADAAVKVIWFGPDDTRIGEETMQVKPGEKYLGFTAKNTASSVKGDSSGGKRARAEPQRASSHAPSQPETQPSRQDGIVAGQ